MDNNTIAVIFFLVVAPTLCAISIPLLSWLEGRNARKQEMSWQTGKTCYNNDTLANNGAEMEYTLITKTGKVMQFYVKAVAELYLSLNGGVLVTNEILATKEAHV